MQTRPIWDQSREFYGRHIGPRMSEQEEMLRELGVNSMAEFLKEVVPESIRSKDPLAVAQGLSEQEALDAFSEMIGENRVLKSLFGQGYYRTVLPSVIRRNVLENPGWYTQYTPYQSEISQGRLRALLNFQTMVSDLTGLSVANSSLLDEATACAEAMSLAFQAHRQKKMTFLVLDDVFTQSIDVVQTRAEPLGIKVKILSLDELEKRSSFEDCFGILFQYPNHQGKLDPSWQSRYQELSKKTDALLIAACDLLALTLFQAPSAYGASIAVGSTQRFGVPMGYGGPHAAFFATGEKYQRLIPGRIVGVSKDRRGREAVRLALQTREQHIRRDRATSNICTAQVLLAVIASMYAVYHGPKGLREIAERVRFFARAFHSELKRLGYSVSEGDLFFDTVVIAFSTSRERDQFYQRLLTKGYLARPLAENELSLSFDERTQAQEWKELVQIFSEVKHDRPNVLHQVTVQESLLESALRQDAYLTHPNFNRCHSETEMLRYIRGLEALDLSLTGAMIPLGSCTMKLNAASEMLPITLPEVASFHPFTPKEFVPGYLKMIKGLETDIEAITGFDAVSMQPNAGSQGEYAGLLVIRAYHRDRGEANRNVCLIPSSAHGTNPASATMAGMKVVVLPCDKQGNIDLQALKDKVDAHRNELAALMVTYPSTHGVFEEEIQDVCRMIHEAGGQVYMDGANLNAQIGLCQAGDFGVDVCHLNLHKTFCIPHGGGGPGMGPIAVKSHLAPFLPSHSVMPDLTGGEKAIGAVSAAPFGSPSILPISWMYIRMMGAQGLSEATKVAILSANAIAHRLSEHFPILYRGKRGRIAHECIIDLRPLKASSGIDVEDVAKRLMDYGFHAPTISFPVAGTMMIEPTESEPQAEIDRFCEAMIAIRGEMEEVISGQADRTNNVLKNAPHTVLDLTSEWTYPYSREKAVMPLGPTPHKFWPSVNRVDNVHGDRNLQCTCPPLEAYAQEEEKAVEKEEEAKKRFASTRASENVKENQSPPLSI